MTTKTKPAKPATRKSRPAAQPASKLVPLKRAKAKPAPSPAPVPAPAPVAKSTKQAQLIQLLKSAPGATLAQMTKLTGWQPHTVRGAISGVLRKKLKLNVACAPQADGSRVYRIVAAA